MPRPVIRAADILEKRRREDGGADLLVQVTLRNGDVRWLAVRRADATLTATSGAVTSAGRSLRLPLVQEPELSQVPHRPDRALA
jgi:hypothetical protein